MRWTVLALLAVACFWESCVTPANAVQVAGSMELWLKADAGVEEAAGDAAEPGDKVYRWLDQSGNNRFLEQTTLAKRADYLASPINGLPALEFNGTNQWMQGNPIPSLNTSSSTIFAVVTGDSTTGGEEQAIFAEKGWSGLVLERNTSALGNLTLYSNYNLGPAPNLIVSPNGNLPTAGYGATLVSAQKVLNTSASTYINGTQQATTVTGIVTAPHAAGNINIGYHDYNVESYTSYDGKYAELLVYSRALNTAERTIVDNYLAAKYDLTISDNKYQGDDGAFGNYDYDVIGIGAEVSGSSTTSSAAGLTITEAGGSLAPSDYLLAGHKTLNNGTTSTAGGELWNRAWYVHKTGSVDATLAFDYSDAGLSPPADASIRIAQLMFAPDSSLNFSPLLLTASVVGDTYTFTVPNSMLVTGYYTLQLGNPVPEPSSCGLILLGLGCWLRKGRRAHRS